eukprot:12585301-Prorocentrum_lima.AAC.1
MLCQALSNIHIKQGEALMGLSEVRTFHSIDMRVRHWDRDVVCPDRSCSLRHANEAFKAVVLDYDLP